MSNKFKIVVSDLHLGAGYKAEGNLLEDFDCDQEFAAFLEIVAAESDRDGSGAELIVNGDAFEFLQVPHVDSFDPTLVYRPDQYHSSSEPDSALKMDLIIAGHRPFFDALGRFIRLGPPRRTVTFIKGNHDVNLHWGAVQDRIRQAMQATGGRTPLLAFEEVCVCREGVYVEHGNQYADSLNRLDDMEEPHDPANPSQLDLPLGSWFVMDVFNQVERERYWIDGVKPIVSLVWYALVYDFAFAARSLATIIRALPGIVEDGLLVTQDPRADLLRQLENPTRLEEIARRYERDEAFRWWFNAEVAQILPQEELSPEASAPMGTVLDASVAGDKVRLQIRSALYGAARRRTRETGARVVVFGHTHDESVEALPDEGFYINSGTWTWRADFSGAGQETWRDLFEHPERYVDDRRLSYVRVDYDEEGRPRSRLLAFEPGDDGPSPGALRALWNRFVGWLRMLQERLQK